MTIFCYSSEKRHFVHEAGERRWNNLALSQGYFLDISIYLYLMIPLKFLDNEEERKNNLLRHQRLLGIIRCFIEAHNENYFRIWTFRSFNYTALRWHCMRCWVRLNPPSLTGKKTNVHVFSDDFLVQHLYLSSLTLKIHSFSPLITFSSMSVALLVTQQRT